MSRRRGTLTLRREDGRIVCDSVTVADSALRRMRGLLGRRALPPDEGIVLRPAWSIHTAFMRFAIDVIFVDRVGRVARLIRDLRPWHVAAAFGASATIECAAGTIAARDVAIGDQLCLEETIEEGDSGTMGVDLGFSWSRRITAASPACSGSKMPHSS